VKEPPDIFTLPKRNLKLKLEEIEGYGETSVRNLFAAIEERRRISLEPFNLRAWHAATSARPPHWRWRAAMVQWKPSTKPASRSPRATKRQRRDDALDQIATPSS